MNVTPYLNFDGNCREALVLYARLLGGEITYMQTHGDSPAAEQTPPDHHDKILHARLRAGDVELMASDAPPGYYSRPQGLFVSLNLDDIAEAERIYDELARDGQIFMKLEETFWAERFAMFTDRFGTPWMINAGPKE
jgi:PhnB protein